jgi:hypothetical protein
VRDLLGETTRPGEQFPDEGDVLGNNAIIPPVTLLMAGKYMEAAEQVAANAVKRLPALLPCSPAAAGEDPCAEAFIDRFGRRAYRRPLAPEERAALVQFYRGAKAQHGFSEAIGLVVQRVLQSPLFLYRFELGKGGAANGLVELTPYEVATRLSFFLWESTPDEALMTAAAEGRLATRAQRIAEARRLLGSSRARAAVASLHTEWLELDKLGKQTKDVRAFPAFTEPVRNLMIREAQELAAHVVIAGDGKLATLLGGPFTFLNQTLAGFYAIPGVTVTGEAFQKVAVEDGSRAGLLTQGALLAINAHARETSPVLRGKFLRERLLCAPLPPPPDGVEPNLPPAMAGLSARERLARHQKDPACAPCHVLIDPMGLAFETFDAVGRFRTSEGGRAIDARGAVVLPAGGEPVRFDGAADLARRLGDSEDARGCVMRTWFRFAFGRSEGDEDDCTLQALGAEFARTGYNVRELLLALAGSDAFALRAVGTAAPAPGGTP